MAKDLVLGLVFSEDLSKVVLIRKNRPKFLAGKLNGIGGHIEGGESHRSAMEREFKEETGVRIIPGWELLGEKVFKDCKMFVWTCRADISQVKTMTDEEVIVCNVDDLCAVKEIEIGQPGSFQPMLADQVETDVLNTYIPAALKHHRYMLSRVSK
jgi:8-oxo-dGTP diphosphatase